MHLRPRAAVVLSGLVLASHASAQAPGAYAGLAWGSTRRAAPGPTYTLGAAPLRSATLGYATRRGAFVEARAARLRERATESVRGGPAPYTLGTRATLLEAAAGVRPPALRLGPFQPVASLGAIWAQAVDTWESDTPEEQQRTSAHGVSAALGVEAVLGRHAALVTRGSYRRLWNAAGRPARRIGLGGPTLEAGLRLGP